MKVRRKWIRAMAEGLLKRHNIKAPPVSVEHIADAQGIKVKLLPFDGDLSGFVYRQGNKAVIWANSRHSKERQHFSLAHELGHFLLHQTETLHVDRPLDLRLRSAISSRGVDPEEIEANLFAAELLMPAQWLLKDLKRLELSDEDKIIEALAKRYEVSTQALAIRLANINTSIG